MGFLPRMLSAVLAVLPVPVSGAGAAPIRDYSVFFAECDSSRCGKRLISIRSFRRGRDRQVMAVDPETLSVEIRPFAAADFRELPASSFTEAVRGTAYGRAIEDAESRRERREAGIDHALPQEQGVVLTIDLCPSPRPLDRRLFAAILDNFLPEEKPVPLGLAVTGVWMEKHTEDLAWLRRLEASGEIAVTFIDHSFNHHYRKDLPLAHNFLLQPGTDLRKEVLLTEALMIRNGLRPSVFFRFPGLISDRRLLGEIAALGLVTVGSDAWLAKMEDPSPGSIVLVHGNGNEPFGIRRFLDLLKKERSAIRDRNWLLLDLRESIRREEQGRKP